MCLLTPKSLKRTLIVSSVKNSRPVSSRVCIRLQNFRRLSLWERNLLSRGNEVFPGVVNFNLNALATMRSPFKVAPARTTNVVGAPPSPAALHRRTEAGQYPQLSELKPAVAVPIHSLETAQNPSLSKAKKSKSTLNMAQSPFYHRAQQMLAHLELTAIPAPSHSGGRLALFLTNQEKLTQDPWTRCGSREKAGLATVTLPTENSQTNVFQQGNECLSNRSSHRDARLWGNTRGSVQRPVHQHYFPEGKNGRGWRSIINLKAVNAFLPYKHFKLEGLPVVLDLIQKEDWMYKIDLRNAYWAVPVHREDRKFLAFQWKGKTCQWSVWPFGFGPIPRSFTKLLKAVMAALRKMGQRNSIYFDDLWGSHQDKETAALHATLTVVLLEHTRWVINYEKSILDPVQKIEYMGYILDSAQMELPLPRDKLEKIILVCKKLRSKSKATVRQVASVAGKLVAEARAVLPAPLHYRNLQIAQIKSLIKGQNNYETKLSLNHSCKQELTWWIKSFEDWNGKSMISVDLEGALEIQTDASNEGWGATCQNIVTQGKFMTLEHKRHINEKELLAASFAVKAFTRDQPVMRVHVWSDNTTCVSQINKMGSTRSKSLLDITSDLWRCCLKNNIMLTAKHLKGMLNAIADEQSRVFQDASDWKLHPPIFKQITAVLGQVDLDLFADRTNHQVESYVSWRPDPTAIATDAFTIKWTTSKPHALPPFCLINKCVTKVVQDKCSLIIITPLWQTAAWWPLHLHHTIEDPVLLPQNKDLLQGPTGMLHPLMESGNLILTAWKVSGKMPET